MGNAHCFSHKKNARAYQALFILSLSTLFFSPTCKKRSDKPEEVGRSGSVRVDIHWKKRGMPLSMEIYEPAVQRPVDLWDTRVVGSLAEAPVSQPISGSSFELAPGSRKMFVLVMKNDTDHPVYFFAAPHHAMPEEYTLGFKFKCLCINHAWEIPPGKTWYRVVELRLASEFRGDTLSITHTLIGITKERMRDYSKEMEL